MFIVRTLGTFKLTLELRIELNEYKNQLNFIELIIIYICTDRSMFTFWCVRKVFIIFALPDQTS